MGYTDAISLDGGWRAPRLAHRGIGTTAIHAHVSPFVTDAALAVTVTAGAP